MPLKGMVCIVTGGSRGIGRAIVRELAGNGASVVFTYLKSADAAAELSDEVKRSGGKERRLSPIPETTLRPEE